MTKNLMCSMCGKHGHEVRKLIAGVAGNICDKCVADCAVIILASEKERSDDIARALSDREAPIPFEGIR